MPDHPQSQPSPDISPNARAKPKVTVSGVVAAVLILLAFLITMILLKGPTLARRRRPNPR